MKPLPNVDVADLVAARPPKNAIALDRPYAFVTEQERSAEGQVEWVSTLFLSNRECPYRCLMCDLWKNTIDDPTPPGAVTEQIDFALGQLPPADHIKLYNNGNFFDSKAIAPRDVPEIAARVEEFETVIIENHPALCGQECFDFADMIGGELEVAMGLETAHAPTLQWLNKGMKLDDFQRAAEYLLEEYIHVRSFVLLNLPGMSEAESEEWAVRSVEFALTCGARCVSIVPTRGGNGLMDRLQRDGLFQPPTLESAERVLERALAVANPQRHRIFLDLWDLKAISTCPDCFESRWQRLHDINLTQRMRPPVVCETCDAAQQ